MLAVLLMDSQPLFIFSGDDCHQHRAAAATAPADSIHWKYLRQRALFAGQEHLKVLITLQPSFYPIYIILPCSPNYQLTTLLKSHQHQSIHCSALWLGSHALCRYSFLHCSRNQTARPPGSPHQSPSVIASTAGPRHFSSVGFFPLHRISTPRLLRTI